MLMMTVMMTQVQVPERGDADEHDQVCGQSLIARSDEMVNFFRSKDEMTVADMHSLVYGI